MAIRIVVRQGKQVIVPVRFERAVTGAPVLDAPDVDDRGFAMGNRPGTWGASTAHGAMVGITEGDTVRVKVRREDIDAGAALYATSSDETIVKVVDPVAGTAVGADGILKIKGIVDSRNKPVKVEIRLGAADGPIVGELEPHIFKLRKVRVLAHLVTIDGVSTARTADTLVDHFDDVNRIWRPAGIEFVYKKAETVTEEITGTRYKRRDGSMRTLPAPMNATAYAAPGTITTHFAGSDWKEFSTLIQIHVAANTVNVYFAQAAPEFNGLTYDNAVARPNGYGVAIVDIAPPYDTAHELGHFLSLMRHADVDDAGTVIHTDMWWIRRLMYSVYPPAAPPHRNDVGYGAGQYGALIAVKNLPSEPRDNETKDARKRALSPY